MANTVELSTTPGSGGSQVAQLVLVGNNGSNTRGALIAGTSSVNVNYGGSVEIDATTLQVDASTRISGGLAIGDATLTPPAAGRILMKASSGATTVPAGCALLYLEDSPATGNKQELWVKFADGTYVKLAGAATA